MPHAIAEEAYTPAVLKTHRKPKVKVSTNGRDQQRLHAILSHVQSTYAQSQLSQNLSKTLASTLKNAKSPIARVLSLGLGSLSASGKGQIRRLKQLGLLLAIRDTLQRITNTPIEIYAQDPVFTRVDEAFLSSLNISILRTPAGSSLGEASSVLSSSTLVYSPFLTLEAYEQLLLHAKEPVKYLVGDDFNALREKWPKHSNERVQVEGIMRTSVGAYRRRVVSGAGFWVDEDESFPMAVYAMERGIRERAKI